MTSGTRTSRVCVRTVCVEDSSHVGSDVSFRVFRPPHFFFQLFLKTKLHHSSNPSMGKHKAKAKATASKDVFSIAWSKVRKVKKTQPVSTKLKKLALPPRDLLSCSNAEFDKVRDVLLCVKGQVDVPEVTMVTEKKVPPRAEPPNVDETTRELAQLTVPSVSTLGQ